MVDQLLAELKRRGLEVYHLEGNTLALRGPQAERTPEIINALKAFKKDLLALYKPPEPPRMAVEEECPGCHKIVCLPEHVAETCEHGQGCAYAAQRSHHDRR